MNVVFLCRVSPPRSSTVYFFIIITTSIFVVVSVVGNKTNMGKKTKVNDVIWSTIAV